MEIGEEPDEYTRGCWGRWCARLLMKLRAKEAEIKELKAKILKAGRYL